MKNVALGGAVVLAALAACSPSIPYNPPPDGGTGTVFLGFDPGAKPPLIPLPNSLAQDMTTGLLALPADAGTPALNEFIATYLDTLNGFPTNFPGTINVVVQVQSPDAGLVFVPGGDLDPLSVNANNVIVVDIAFPDGGVPVNLAYDATTHTVAISPPTGGWLEGRTYLVAALINQGAPGTTGTGLVDTKGHPASQTPAWALVTSPVSLVTCTDLTSPDCMSSTALLTNAQAIALEPIRVGYKPIIDGIVAYGVPRANIGLLWSFGITSQVALAFDPAGSPPVIPLPNDLLVSQTTGLLQLPADAGSPALNELIATYFDQLNGFPTAFPGSMVVQGGDLDPATVNGANLVLVDLAAPTAVVPATFTYQSSDHTVSIVPTGGWTKGHHYVAVGLTGISAPGTVGSGLNSANHLPVVPSEIWALARSKSSLVTCVDLTAPDCASTINLLTTAQALQLEQLRRLYAPILDGLTAQGIPRINVGLMWTFGATSQPEATFDPLNPLAPVIPFPNDLLRSPTTGLVTLPIPPDAGAQLIALYTGLNTLDGFSTSAPAVSCNSTVLGAIEPGLIDPATIAAGGAGFVALSTTAHTPQINICLNCASSALADGGPQTSPQRLQFVPKVPLDEATPYAGFMTSALKDTSGTGVVPSQTFAVLRLTNPVFDGTHSTLPFLDDATAAAAEAGRKALSPLLDALGANGGLPRSDLVLAWAFTTESTVSQLKGLHDYAANPLIPKNPLTPLVDITAPTLAAMTTAGLPHAAIGKIFFGEIVLDFLLTGPGGTLKPAAPQTIRTPLLLTLPATPAPAGGYPVTIYGHGLTGARTNALAIADAIAGGALAPVPDTTPRATVAIDTVWHGARTSCTGSAAVFPAGSTDDAACADPVAQKCDEQLIGNCIARDPSTRAPCDPSLLPVADLGCHAASQGFCLTDAAGLLPDGGSICSGGEFLAAASDGEPVISGWNMIRIDNFFAFRDNFRYPVTDLSVLRAVIGQDQTVTGSLNALLAGQVVGTLSTSDVTYIGQSLGAILGMNYTSVAPEISTVVLAPPGGNLPLIGLTSPAFKPYADAYLAAVAAQGIVQGTPQFDDLFAINNWILDPSDPVNSAWNVLNSSLPGVNLPANRAAFVQYIDQDEVIPNPTTQLVLTAFQKSGPTPAPAVHFFNAATDPMPPVGHRHAFLVNYANPQTTAKAQSEAVKFVNTGTYP